MKAAHPTHANACAALCNAAARPKSKYSTTSACNTSAHEMNRLMRRQSTAAAVVTLDADAAKAPAYRFASRVIKETYRLDESGVCQAENQPPSLFISGGVSRAQKQEQEGCDECLFGGGHRGVCRAVC